MSQTYFDLLYDYDILELCLPNYMSDTINLIEFTKNEQIPYKMEYREQTFTDEIRNKLVELTVYKHDDKLFQQPFPKVKTMKINYTFCYLSELKLITESLPNVEYIYIQCMGCIDIEYSKINTKCSQLIIDHCDFDEDVSNIIDFKNINYIRVNTAFKPICPSVVEIYHNSSKELTKIKGINYDIFEFTKFVNERYPDKVEVLYANYCMTQVDFESLKKIKHFKLSGCYYYDSNNVHTPIDDFNSNTKNSDAMINTLYANST
jgi:hypothetical protein